MIIKSFKITKLFGSMDVNILISNDRGIQILIGENGIGKTTILNILYYALKADFYRLAQYDFESFELEVSEQSLRVTHEDLETYINIDNHGRLPNHLVENIISSVSKSEIIDIQKRYKTDPKFIDDFSLIIGREKMRHYPPSIVRGAIKQYCCEELSENLTKYKAILDKVINNTTVLYFPTFRRIEEDLKNLNIDVGEEDRGKTSEKLIQFGMDDIKRRFQKIQDDIQKLSSQGLARISSEILSQLIKGTPEISAEQISNIDNESIEIILARVGKALSDDDKKSIIEKIKKKNIAEEDRFLMYFINKLVEIYEEQRKLDNKVKSYINICNEYLSHSKKSIVYSESEVEFYIKSFLYKEEKLLINFLNKLSSGEKQILSLFAKIYLTDNDEEFVVLFDEPELSLSIYWQEKLLPDIANSGKCKTLIAVTHSPFIYDNDLKEYANGLNEYLAVKVDN